MNLLSNLCLLGVVLELGFLRNFRGLKLKNSISLLFVIYLIIVIIKAPQELLKLIVMVKLKLIILNFVIISSKPIFFFLHIN